MKECQSSMGVEESPMRNMKTRLISAICCLALVSVACHAQIA